MIISTKIIKESPKSTVSELSINGEFFCYLLEDGHNLPKKMRETRIPHGMYLLEPRKDGRHYLKYSDKWGHKFTMWVRHIPNYLWVMLHIGNYHQDSYGCPLVGTTYTKYRDDYMVGQSTVAYKKLYKELNKIYVQTANDFRFTEKVIFVVDRAGSKYETQEAINLERIITDR